MPRVKVISDPGDLAVLLRAFEPAVNRDVFRALITDWRRAGEIESQWGATGLSALTSFEKVHLVETRFLPGPTGPEKAYRSYYTAFHVNTSIGVEEITDVLHVAVMGDVEFNRIEGDIVGLLGEQGVPAKVACEKLNITVPFLKSLVKRSTALELRGHTIVRRTP